MKCYWICSHFHVRVLQFHVTILSFHVGFSVFTKSDMKLLLSTWNHSFRHETTTGDMNDSPRSAYGPTFFNFFLTFMSVRCNLALFSANWPHITGTKLHFFSSFHIFWYVFSLQFSRNSLFIPWICYVCGISRCHFASWDKHVSTSCSQLRWFGRSCFFVFTENHSQKALCWVVEAGALAPWLLFAMGGIASPHCLCSLCGCCTVMRGQATQNHSQKALCWLTKAGALAPWLPFAMGGHASPHCVCSLCGCCTVMLGQAFCSWAETTAKCSPIFRTPHLHMQGFVNDSLCRAVIPV